MKLPVMIALMFYLCLLVSGIPAAVGRMIAPHELMPWESGSQYFWALFE